MDNNFWKRFYKEFESQIGEIFFLIIIAAIIGAVYLISFLADGDLIVTFFAALIIYVGVFCLFGIIFLLKDFVLHIKTLRRYNEKLPHIADEIQNMNFDNFTDLTQYMHDISTYVFTVGPIKSASFHLKINREEVIKVLDIAMIAFPKEKEIIVAYKECLLDLFDKGEKIYWFVFKYN